MQIAGLTEGKDYTVTYADNVNAGEAKATVSGIGNYEGTADLYFTISPKSIKNFTAENKEKASSGKGSVPADVTVTDPDTADVLVKGKDYTLSTDITEAGETVLVIRGKGNYTGRFFILCDSGSEKENKEDEKTGNQTGESENKSEKEDSQKESEKNSSTAEKENKNAEPEKESGETGTTGGTENQTGDDEIKSGEKENTAESAEGQTDRSGRTENTVQPQTDAEKAIRSAKEQMVLSVRLNDVPSVKLNGIFFGWGQPTRQIERR